MRKPGSTPSNNVSRWAGYAASVFSIAMLAVGTVFYTQAGDTTPIWMPLFMGGCLVLGACSGVVCLVSAMFAHFTEKRNSRDQAVAASEPSPEEKP